jgi:hypothetical protein
MLIGVWSLSMFIFFIVFIIFNTQHSQKYVIEDKTTTSPKRENANKRIKQARETARGSGPVNQHDDTLHFYA